jgi:hypothetical protein
VSESSAGNQRRMNSQKKIEAFKNWKVVDPNYAEKTLKVIEDAIQDVFNHNPENFSLEELYRFCPLCFI